MMIRLLALLVVLFAVAGGTAPCSEAQERESEVPVQPPVSVDSIAVPDTLSGQTAVGGDLPVRRASGNPRFPVWFTPSAARSIHGMSVGPVLSWPEAHRWTAVNGVGVSALGFGTFPVLFYGPAVVVMPLEEFAFLDDYDGDGTLEGYQSDGDTIAVKKPPALAERSEFGTVVNGLLLSPGGDLAHHIRGLSVSGLIAGAARTDGVIVNGVWTMSGRHNGLLVGAFANVGRGRGVVAGGSALSVEMTGVQVAAVNQAVRMEGLQVGLYNFAGDLAGIQIGLLNRTSERTLPLLNWGID